LCGKANTKHMNKIIHSIRLQLKQHLLTVIGAVVGGVGGFLYWYFIGCASGTCPIQSNPFMSTVWGLLLGGLIFSLFEKKRAA
jgi:hypothetical protein